MVQVPDRAFPNLRAYEFNVSELQKTCLRSEMGKCSVRYVTAGRRPALGFRSKNWQAPQHFDPNIKLERVLCVPIFSFSHHSQKRVSFAKNASVRFHPCSSRPTLSQFHSLKIRRLSDFMKFRKDVRRILKLHSCEMVGRASYIF